MTIMVIISRQTIMLRRHTIILLLAHDPCSDHLKNNKHATAQRHHHWLFGLVV